MIETFIATVGAAIFILGIALSELVESELKIMVLAVSIATFAMSIVTAAYIEYKNGKYVCKNCGKAFKPTVFQYILSPHFGSTRNFRCPECGEKGWCKRIKDKD